MPVTKTKTNGKTAFIKEVLFDNPKANHKLVNEAWKAAGMPGTISDSLVNTLRSELGYTGNLRKTSKSPSGSSAGKSTKTATAAKTAKKATPTSRAKVSARASVKNPRAADLSRAIVDAEADIDRLIFKLMGVGGLLEIEDALRGVRRKLVLRSHKV
jgi:hypothetical protein